MPTAIEYRPQGSTLRQFHDSDAFFRTIIGPLGSGKTSASIFEAMRRSDCQKAVEIDSRMVRRSRGAIVRNTYSELIATTIKDYKEYAPVHLGDFTMSPFPQHTYSYKRPDGTYAEVEVLFLAFDREDHVKKARGLQLTWVAMDEGKELAKSVIDMLLGRIGRFPARASYGDYWYGAWMTSNAPAADHWLGEVALKTKPMPEGWEVFIQPGGVRKESGKWVVNPSAENLQNLPPGYYQRQLGGKREDWIRANLANEFVHVVDGRPVHPDFSQRYHVADLSGFEPYPGIPVILGIDFGRTPSAAIMQQQTSGQWLVFDEFGMVNSGAKKFGRELRAYLNARYPSSTFRFWGDPAGDDLAQSDDLSPIMALQSEQIDCFPAPTNDPIMRREALDSLLTSMIDGEPAIIVSSTCRNIVRGLAGSYYMRRVQAAGQERYTDKPEKTPESHYVEALHYGLLGEGEGDRAMFDQSWSREFNDVEEWAPPASIFE
jgi:hypothetical protein